MEITMAVTGRLIKVSAIIFISGYDDFLFVESADEAFALNHSRVRMAAYFNF